MLDFLRRSWAVVDLDAIAHNYRQIRSHLPETARIMAIVKADGYGHGDSYVAKALVQEGADFFGVSNLEEALGLRKQGITQPILILGATPPEHAAALAENNITQAMYSLAYAKALESAAHTAGVRVHIHAKADTGMGRLGFVVPEDDPAPAVEELLQVNTMPHLVLDGLFTHFACADENTPEAIAYTQKQIHSFKMLREALERVGIRPALCHCCNSAGVLNYTDAAMDLVRPGIILYGLEPGDVFGQKLDLHPAMELYTTVSMVKEVPAGTTLSYGRIYTALSPMKVATVPIGYADGYERSLSNRARMLVRGQYATVVGRVCMDQLMLDVTHIPDVAAGDLVTIVGTDGGKTLTFNEMAALSGTVAYEKLCLIGKRIPRIYRKNGQEWAVMDAVRKLSGQ